MNDIKDNFDKLLRAIRYLFKGGNLLYWGLLAVVLCINGFHDYQQAEIAHKIFADAGLSPDCSITDPKCFDAMLDVSEATSGNFGFFLLQMAAGFLLACKMFDGIMRISEGLEEEPVPYAPVTLVPFLTPLKYLVGMIIIGIVLLPLWLLGGPHAWLFPFLFVTWLFAPAMIMNLIGNDSIGSMISPGGWVQVIRNMGIGNYLSILLFPLITLIGIGFVLGFIVGIIAGITHSPMLLVFMIAVIQAFATALTYLYIGYFMREKESQDLSEAEQRVLYEADTYRMDEEEKKQFAQDLLAVDVLMQEGGFREAETLLLNYTSVHRDIGQYFPAYRILYEFYQVHHRYEELPALEQRLIEAAVHGNERCYLCVRKAVENIALDDIARLPADWIKPLARMAGEHHDYSAARALDKTGKRDQALHLLAQLINHYPDHPKTAQIRHSYELLQKQANPKPEQGA
ncbi:DUF4013 domain-containing protein [Cardiobacterium valvarum]|uniref:Tetratricopeptide repeat protein n=1 Tax=Cardiobacterium valvarum F0432 TaxID=797473 RepID=G9ZE18_9GAMM|nr:DUF4013 domain-containing protein [Cardiobacterium valvarum]EHM55043.1 hypothetical protein HMPREF9080_01002 [Cardiobacterium valvarum F0432]